MSHLIRNVGPEKAITSLLSNWDMLVPVPTKLNQFLRFPLMLFCLGTAAANRHRCAQLF
jgi:hypothetical protein